MRIPCLSDSAVASADPSPCFVDDNWIRALVFHPSGKFLLSASDDKTVRTWDLVTGRCIKTLDAHTHFVSCMSWGRAPAPGAAGANGAVAGASKADVQPVNVLATGSVDLSVRLLSRVRVLWPGD